MIQSSPERIAESQQRGWWGQATVDDVFRDAVARADGEEAVVDPPNKDELTGSAQQRYTFAELDRLVDGLASRLLALGLRKDDVLATQLPNTVEAVVAFLACARLGLVFCPVAMQFREHELRYILGKSGASAFMTVPITGPYWPACSAGSAARNSAILASMAASSSAGGRYSLRTAISAVSWAAKSSRPASR